VREAVGQIITYSDDPLPGLEGGRRPPLGYLGRIEARLRVAGFSYKEIADLICDTGRAEDDRAKRRTAERSHVDRIRKRVAQFKPAVELHQKKEAAADARMEQFLRRTGYRTIHDAGVDVWLQSIEAKALDRDVKRLEAASKIGK
jgi:DNA-binding transcriptional MerR regulator